MHELDPQFTLMSVVANYNIRDWLHKHTPSYETIDKILLIATLSSRMRHRTIVDERDIKKAIRNVDKYSSVSELQAHRAFCLDLIPKKG